MHQNAPRRRAGRPRFSLRLVMLVVALCCIAAWFVPWGLRRIALDPFSPAGLARDRILRGPVTESDVKRSTPHTSGVRDVESLPLDLENADPAILEALNQSADVMYGDVALGEVLDDISTNYNIAFDKRAIAGTDAKVVLLMKGSLQSVLETILRETNLYCDVEGSVMVIRARKDTSASESAAVSSQDSATRSTMGTDREVVAPVDPFAPPK